jgi:hypothetical protein
VCGWAADIGPALDEGEGDGPVGRHARQLTDGVTRRIDDRITDGRARCSVDDTQGPRRTGDAAVHPLDELLTGIAALGEADGNRLDACRRRNRLPRLDLGTHPWPPGGDASGLVRHGRRLDRCRLDAQLGIDADLEARQPGCQPIAEAGIGVEHEAIVGETGDAGEHLDLSAGLEDQCPAALADREITDVLGQLALQVRRRIGTLDGHPIARLRVDERCVELHVVGHVPSLAWHTAIAMSDDPRDWTSADDADPQERRLTELAQQAVDSFMLLVRRGTAFAVGVLAIVALICLSSFALGIAVLSDGMELVWILFGGFFAFLAIGSVMLAMFRLWTVKRLSGELVREVRALVTSDPSSERVVIETVESSDRVQGQSAVVMSRQFFAMNDSIGDRRAQFTGLAVAMRSITTFPLLILMASGITFVFAILGFFFTLGLIF